MHKCAEVIFAEAHRPHSDWPLDRCSEKRIQLMNEAWKITRERVSNDWAPPDAKPQL